MSTASVFDSDTCFEINPLYMFRWEELQKAYVLLYPEGIVKLNPTAGEILKRCTGECSVGDLVADIKNRYSASDTSSAADIEQSTYKFLEVSRAKGWIRRKS